MFGAIRIVTAIIALGICLLAGIMSLTTGFQQRSKYLANRNRFVSPISLTMAEFAKKLPTDGWYRITDATTAADEAAFTSFNSSSGHSPGRSGGIERAVVPAYDPDTLDAKSELLVITDNVRLRKVLNEMRNLGLATNIETSSGSTSDDRSFDNTETGSEVEAKPRAKPDQKTVDAWSTANADRIIETRPIEGLIRNVGEFDADTQDLCRSVAANAAPNCVLLEEGATPTAQDNGSFFIGFGALLVMLPEAGAVMLLYVRLRRRNSEERMQ
jgi:hypothetical protein